MKQNCWEFMKCGREPGGDQAELLGVCPVPADFRFHGVHGGRAAGRACWVVAGTFCDDEVHGTFAEKYDSCFQCDFYQAVKKEEAAGFQHSGCLLHRHARWATARISPSA